MILVAQTVVGMSSTPPSGAHEKCGLRPHPYLLMEICILIKFPGHLQEPETWRGSVKVLPQDSGGHLYPAQTLGKSHHCLPSFMPPGNVDTANGLRFYLTCEHRVCVRACTEDARALGPTHS